MSKIDTMKSKSNLDCIADELFTELNQKEAQLISGGTPVPVGIEGVVDFDYSLRSSNFYSYGGGGTLDVKMDTITGGVNNFNNNYFTVTLYQDITLGSDKNLGSHVYSINSDNVIKSFNMGDDSGYYYLKFSDVKDGERIMGTVRANTVLVV